MNRPCDEIFLRCSFRSTTKLQIYATLINDKNLEHDKNVNCTLGIECLLQNLMSFDGYEKTEREQRK